MTANAAGGFGGAEAAARAARASRMLAAAVAAFQGMAGLDLSGAPVRDADLAAALKALPRLVTVNLHRCQKLSPHVLAACLLAGGDGSHPPPHLACLGVTRCFQLSASALVHALAWAASVPVVPLTPAPRDARPLAPPPRAIALSHLNLESFPAPPPDPEAPAAATLAAAVAAAEGGGWVDQVAADAAAGALAYGDAGVGAAALAVAVGGAPPPALPAPFSAPPTSTIPPTLRPAPALRVLALHNCRLTPAGLTAIAASCPALEFLALGGSTLALPPTPWGGGVIVGVGGVGGVGIGGGGVGGLGAALAALSQPPARPARARVAPPNLLPMAEISAALAALRTGGGGGGAGQHAAPTTAGSTSPTPTDVAAVAEGAALVDTIIASLPRLTILELTFFPPAAVAMVTAAARPTTSVWDLTRPVDAAAAACVASTARSAAAAGDAAAAGILLGLSAASNCSSGGRAAPLHAAVEACCLPAASLCTTPPPPPPPPLALMDEDDGFASRSARAVIDLLSLGARPDARDRTGATPAFVAAERGAAAPLAALLAAGADARVLNAAGEAPLYISALRGHKRCVELLLEALATDGGPAWVAPNLYGDGWTPLMAAALAGRADIAACLLNAAAASSSATRPAAASLARAANRYGQTAAHIAARRGCGACLDVILGAGGPALAATVDAAGEAPASTAARHGHTGLAATLRAAAASVNGGRGSGPPPPVPSCAPTQRGADRPRW